MMFKFKEGSTSGWLGRLFHTYPWFHRPTMSSPAHPKPADQTEEGVDLGEESDDYDAEFDVNVVCMLRGHALTRCYPG
jgi:hypothetical protein